MASSNRPTGTHLVVPDVFVYICGHTAIGAEHGLQRIYASLLDHGLIPRPESVCELTHHCPKCLDDAFEEARGQSRRGTSKRKWGDMVLHPLHNPTTDDTVFRMSAMVMFRDLWELLNTRSLHPFFFSRDVLTHDIFFAFRHWCKTMALHAGRKNHGRTFEQLVAVLGELFGGGPWPSTCKIPWTSTGSSPARWTRSCPKTGSSGTASSASATGVSNRSPWASPPARTPSTSPTSSTPCFGPRAGSARSSWARRSIETCTGTCLPTASGTTPTTYGPEEQARLEQVLLELNDAAMLFKVQLYEMFNYTETTGYIRDEGELLRIMGLVTELEGRYDFIRPLWDEKKRLWRLFVEFAEPHRELFALASVSD
ncbi:hypothetical protein PG991_000097 [Apiospora marii]|uniref:Uncharacterized protein n=1 Tax=Apiospora marii TaxID=335849 RepID=A0ABR1T327_9PEZI